MSEQDQYIQDIRCEKCAQLLGYSQFGHDNCRCVQCNGTPSDDVIMGVGE